MAERTIASILASMNGRERGRKGYARGQTRVVDGKEVFVEIPPMNRTFTLKCDDTFIQALEKLHREAQWRWSYSAIIRELVCKAAGVEVEMEARDIRKYPHQLKHERKVVVVPGSKVGSPSPEQQQEWIRRMRAATEESGPNNLLRAILDGKVEMDPEVLVQRMEAKYGVGGSAVRREDADGAADAPVPAAAGDFEPAD